MEFPRWRSSLTSVNAYLLQAVNYVEYFANFSGKSTACFGTSGNNSPYNSTKSVLPNNHMELWKKSMPDQQERRWAIERTNNEIIYHRFQTDPNTGVYHWNGSTNGKTASGVERKISINEIPNFIKEGNK